MQSVYQNVPAQQIIESPQDQSKNSFNFEKILGYLLLLVGIAMILTSLFLVYQVLTGKNKPPQIFNVESPTIKLPTASSNLQLPEGLELPEGFSLQEATNEATPAGIKIIPDELLNGMVNISLYYLLMMFAASTGVKIADIGTKLIKEIKIKAQE